MITYERKIWNDGPAFDDFMGREGAPPVAQRHLASGGGGSKPGGQGSFLFSKGGPFHDLLYGPGAPLFLPPPSSVPSVMGGAADPAPALTSAAPLDGGGVSPLEGLTTGSFFSGEPSAPAAAPAGSDVPQGW